MTPGGYIVVAGVSAACAAGAVFYAPHTVPLPAVPVGREKLTFDYQKVEAPFVYPTPIPGPVGGSLSAVADWSNY